jgi:hypothetical protein
MLSHRRKTRQLSVSSRIAGKDLRVDLDPFVESLPQ